MAGPRAHGRLLAADVGELVGVSGTTIGQWARRGYIRSSQADTEPRVYAVEDVAEAAVVRALLDRGVRRAEIRRVIARLRHDAAAGVWPLVSVRLATAGEGGRPRLLVRFDGAWHELRPRGWQRVAAVAGAIEEVAPGLNLVSASGRRERRPAADVTPASGRRERRPAADVTPASGRRERRPAADVTPPARGAAAP